MDEEVVLVPEVLVEGAGGGPLDPGPGRHAVLESVDPHLVHVGDHVLGHALHHLLELQRDAGLHNPDNNVAVSKYVDNLATSQYLILKYLKYLFYKHKLRHGRTAELRLGQ